MSHAESASSESAESAYGARAPFGIPVPETAASRLVGAARRFRARLPVYLTDLRDDPRWVLMFTLGRLMPVRRALWRLGRPGAAASGASALFPAADLAIAQHDLERDGIHLGLQLPAEIVGGILRFAEATPCFGDFDRAVAFLPGEHAAAEEKFARPILVGHYLDEIEACPELDMLRRDPLLHDIAARYLAADPILISSRLWWSFPARRIDDAALNRASQERFHFDMNDWRSLKFFFYLTDVDRESGPHVYVRGSHRRRRIRHQLTLYVGKSTDDITRFYGTEPIVRIHGPAGFGFAEDPFGFHMGTVAHRPRLMAEVEFGISRPTRRRYYGDQRF
jgi:hypothetical protein